METTMINKIEIEGQIIIEPKYNYNKKLTKFLICNTSTGLNHITNQKYIRHDNIWIVVWGNKAIKAENLDYGDMVKVKGYLRVKSIKIQGIYKTFTSVEAINIKYSHFGNQYRDLFNGKF